MTALAPPRSHPGPGLRHEAVFFSGTDELLDRAVPFVRDGLAGGEPVMVALVDAQWQPLRAALGDAADLVHRVDMAELGRNPARILPAWHDFIDRHGAGARPLRGLGVPVWAGRTAAEVAECHLHEALLNLALPAQTPLWLLCPYDVDALGADVVDEVRRSHPTVTDAAGAPVAADCDVDHARALWRRDLPPAGGRVESVTFGRGDLSAIRRLVRQRATPALGRARAEDLILAVNELAANSLDHGGGRGVLRTWSEPGALLCEVTDSGRIDDVLVGRTAPAPGQLRGRGVWMVNQLCDLVQIRSTAAGTVVRVHSWV